MPNRFCFLFPYYRSSYMQSSTAYFLIERSKRENPVIKKCVVVQSRNTVYRIVSISAI